MTAQEQQVTQQQQTQEYFGAAAQDWQNKSVNAQGTYSVIEGRSRCVLDVVDQAGASGRFLDVGCGTGQLVIAVAGRGWQAEGIDFAPEMITQCRTNAREAGVDAQFTADSFFTPSFVADAYDVVSAQGFIEYLAPEETDEFFRRAARMLKPSGSLVVGSRNRLFNAFSLNDFTRQEVEFGTLTVLIAEAAALQAGTDTAQALAALRRFERIDPQFGRHPVTGIPVETRYQFTPAELSHRLRRAGLTVDTLYPVHFHGLPLAVKAEQPALHSDMARAVSEIGFGDHRLVPFCSTFVVRARRGE